VELMISVVIGILIVEAYAWLPKLSEWLIDRAVQPLRSEDQNRCREEWMAGLAALPNTLIRLVHALSYIGAAHKINAECFERRITAIDALIEECDQKHSSIVGQMRTAKETLGNSQTKLRQKLNAQLIDLKSHVKEAPKKGEEITAVLQNAVTAFEKLADTYVNVGDRSTQLLTTCVDRITDRLNHVQGLLLRAVEKRNQLTTLLGRRDVSPDMLESLLVELTGDLKTIKTIFADDNWGDDASFREHERISAAIKVSFEGLSALAGS
jgi:hypothetical protein